MNRNQQPLAEPQFKVFTGALKAFKSESGRRTIHCTASSAVDDLHGDIIVEDCVRDMAVQAKAKGMTIFLNHEYKVPKDIFGRTVDANVVMRRDENNALVADMDLDVDVNEANDLAVETHEAIMGPNGNDGVTLGVSIGAIITDYAFRDEKAKFSGGLEIKAVNLLEASIVGIPANPRSWVQNGVLAIAKSLGENTDQIKALWKVADEPEDEAPEEPDEAEVDETAPDNVEDDDTEPQPVKADLVVEEDGVKSHRPVHADGVVTMAEETFEKLIEVAEERNDLLKSHSELPDSAFACIESGGKKVDGKTRPLSLRHYPHHTASGGLDENLLRNALSRIGDKSNIQCGKSHLMAHAKSAGIGEKTEDGFEVKMGDEIWVLRDVDPEYDHEPEESEPFTGSCGCSEPDEEAAIDLDLAPEGEAQENVEETATADLEATKEIALEIAADVAPDLREAFLNMVAKLEESLTTIEALKAENRELTSKLATAKDDFEVAAEIVDSLSRLPLARKTTARKQVSSFYQKFQGVYPEAWLRLMEERDKENP